MSRELVACIRSEDFSRFGSFHGYTKRETYYPLLSWPSIMIDREEADKDLSHIQIIPYLTVERIAHGARQYLAYTRMKQGGEVRLHGRKSIGFGGHMNHTENIGTALYREIREELPDISNYTVNFCGFLRDEHTPVGRVHLGVHYEVMVDHHFQMKSDDPSIGKLEWQTLDELAGRIDTYEEWSKILIQEVLLP